jgi:tetratricopeptide (TPR) repeat protein
MEYNRRPENIEANETVAWMYFENNEPRKALPYLQEAIKTNSKNPTLLCRAGLIFAKNGDTVKATKYLQDAVQNNPNIDETLKVAALQQLKSLVTFSK